MSLLAPKPAVSTPADQYDAVAVDSARLVIRRYTTSFGLACRLLAEPVRAHVCNVYALVRVADELVDAPRAGAGNEQRRMLLDGLEAETLAALTRGHSANLVVHAFARTAAACGIGPDLLIPFFASMRTSYSPVRPVEPSSHTGGRCPVGRSSCCGTLRSRPFCSSPTAWS